MVDGTGDDKLPPQQVGRKFTTTGYGDSNKADAFKLAYGNAKREAQKVCDTNPECKKVKFGGYVSVGPMVFPGSVPMLQLVCEWTCSK